MQIRSVLLVLSLALASCQSVPLHQTPYGFARGGALTDDEYARLEPFVRSQTWNGQVAGDPAFAVPAALYAYSFVPSFDPKTITRLEVRPFQGKAGEAAKIAAKLTPKLAETLTDRGIPALVGSTGSPEGFSISGTVTRADPAIVAPDALAIQIEARVNRGNTSVGVIQINLMHSEQSDPIGGTPLIIIGQLIAQASAPNFIEMASTLLSNPFRQAARTGAREGISSNAVATIGMLTKETGYGKFSGKAVASEVGQPQPAASLATASASKKAAQ